MKPSVDGRHLPASDCIQKEIGIDSAIHPVSSVQRACYALADRATFDISRQEGHVNVLVKARMGYRLEEVVDQFRTSLIDYTLREEIEANTQGLRELIWQTAFAEARGRGGS